DHARFAAEIATAGGVGELDRIALRKLLAGKVVQVSATLGELEEGLSGSASPEDLETMLQLVHLRMTAPRRDPEAFAAWKAGELEDVRHRLLDPQRTFLEELEAFLFQKHPRRRPVTPEVLERVDLDKALAI